MDDLTEKINAILSDPGAMERVKGLASMLGQNMQDSPAPLPAESAPAQQPADGGGGADNLSGLISALAGGMNGGTQPAAAANTANTGNALAGLLGGGNSAGGMDPNLPGMIAQLTKLAPMFAALRQEDDTTRLLHALRPMLRPTRQKKLDEAVRLLQLLRMLPLLKQSGLMNSLGSLGGLGGLIGL